MVRLADDLDPEVAGQVVDVRVVVHELDVDLGERDVLGVDDGLRVRRPAGR